MFDYRKRHLLPQRTQIAILFWVEGLQVVIAVLLNMATIKALFTDTPLIEEKL